MNVLTAGLGTTELLIMLIMGALCIGLPVALAVLAVYLVRRR